MIGVVEPMVRTGADNPTGDPLSFLWPLIVILLVPTIWHAVARWRRKRHPDRGPEPGRGSGLGRALTAMTSLLQPNMPDEDARPDRQIIREDEHSDGGPDPARAPLLFQDDQWPDDGLRTPLSMAGREDGE